VTVNKKITYAQAINQGMHQAMQLSSNVMVMGQLIDYSSGVFGTTVGLVDKFGKNRVRDFPVAESLMTSAGIGAAIAGQRVILVHIRLDFMMYSLDAVVNWLSLWRFKSNKESNIPLVIRAIIGKGWGQGPQHSKSLHSWFAHLPGLKVAIPATAFDAKGLLLESVFSEGPSIIIEHRALFGLKDQVPLEPYRVRYGKAIIRRKGRDVTLVSLGYLLVEALKAANTLEKKYGISVEVVDLRTLTPLDRDTINNSVKKTGRLVVVDPAWHSFGAASEIITSIIEKNLKHIKSKPARITLPDSHTPMSKNLEKSYYFGDKKIVSKILKIIKV
jgi:pyruvate dehydrogenase E1 component beta subunit|tara:strand:- start:637 stop:1626 length:990 start_codon:yes stop_codon:yes gene_type:complete